MESTIEMTLDHVKKLARHPFRSEPRTVTIVILMEMGFPTQNLGFELLKRAVVLQKEDPTRALQNDIYLELTRACRQSSERQVEQAIRDIINTAWRRGSKRAWDWYFSYDGRSVTKKPTNSEFISRIAYIVELWQEYVWKGGQS